jgi:K+-sensing histidine kinase KdpD
MLAPAAPVTERLIGDLGIMPSREIMYRGITLTEMDVDAVRSGRAIVLALPHSPMRPAKRSCRS